MRALVTGGAGFIGSHVVDALIARGDRVGVLDDLSNGRPENLAGALARGAWLREGTVTDLASVQTALTAAHADTVLHLAAQIDVRRAVADPRHDAAVNVLGTLTVLEAARLASVRRVVLASTGGAIYGDAEVIPTPEEAPPRPLSPYGASKACAEAYMDLYAREHGVSTMSLRFANVYGPRQDARGEAGVIALFCDAAVRGAPVTVFGDGEQTRDFVYVGDVVEAFLAAADAEACGCCNVGTGRETPIRELAAALGLEAVAAPGRPGEVRRSCLDAGRAVALLGWRARTSLRYGLERTLAAAPAGEALSA
jgi:UDP-glucose 4-epimerase